MLLFCYYTSTCGELEFYTIYIYNFLQREEHRLSLLLSGFASHTSHSTLNVSAKSRGIFHLHVSSFASFRVTNLSSVAFPISLPPKILLFVVVSLWRVGFGAGDLCVDVAYADRDAKIFSFFSPFSCIVF